MESRQIFQTTLIHPLRPEYSVAALFVCANFSEHSDIDTVLEAFGIESISGGSISEPELKRIMAYILSDAADIFDMNDAAFRTFANGSDISIEFLDKALYENSFIIEEERPERRGLNSLLLNSFGASVGQYAVPEHARLHDTSGQPKITLLNVNLPYGVMLCGSSRGIDRALHYGLHAKICAWLTSPKNQKNKTATGLFAGA